MAIVDATRTDTGWTAQVRDESDGQQFEIRSRTIVNATGCWADRIPHSHVRLRKTKGIHLVVDARRFATDEAVVITEGSRILFAIPWGERVILGTTDTDYDGSLEEVPTNDEDIAYILNTVNGVFPVAHLEPRDVLSHWAGVRPLIASGRIKKGTPSNTSRNHQIRMPIPGWIDVAGGKLTTYRLMAQQTIDRIGRHLGVSMHSCRTADEPLLDTDSVSYSRITPPPVARDAVEHYCAHEWAQHLDDVMLRRTSWHYYHCDAARIANQTALWMQELLGWDDAMLKSELERYAQIGRSSGGPVPSV